MREQLMISNIPANAVRDLFRDADTGESDARFIKQLCQVTFAIHASAVGIELNLYAGERTIVQRSTVESGATTGVFPNLDQKALVFYAAPDEKLRATLRETAAVATTDIMATVDIEPL